MTAIFVLLSAALFACMALRIGCARPVGAAGHTRIAAQILIAVGAFWSMTHPHGRSLSEWALIAGVLILLGIRWPRARE